MRFKNGPQLPGAGRTRAGHHHGSHTPTSPEAIILGKMAHHTKQIRRQCMMERGFRFSRTFVEYVQVFQLELVSSGLICITDVSSPISSPLCWSTFHNGVKKID